MLLPLAARCTLSFSASRFNALACFTGINFLFGAQSEPPFQNRATSSHFLPVDIVYMIPFQFGAQEIHTYDRVS